MGKVIDISEIVEALERDGKQFEVCASAQGGYDDATGRLELTLDSFLRPVDLVHKEQHMSADWLPARQVVREAVAWQESSALAKEIFRRWALKVRQSIPSLASP